VQVDTSSVRSVISEEHRSGVRRRQFRSVEQKRQMVQETLKPGVSVAVIARRHGINANQLFSWRRQYQRGALERADAPAAEAAALMPVVVEQIRASQTPSEAIAIEGGNEGRIDIEFNGGRRVSIWGRADMETLSAVLREFSRS
jgi:transposase